MMDWQIALLGAYSFLGVIWFAFGFGLLKDDDHDLKTIGARMILTGIIWPVWILIGIPYGIGWGVCYLWRTADWTRKLE